MESGRMTTQRWPSLSSLAMCTAAAMAVPELPPVTEKKNKNEMFSTRQSRESDFVASFKCLRICQRGLLPHSRPSSLISMRDMLKESSSFDLYQVSTTYSKKEKTRKNEVVVSHKLKKNGS